MMYQRLMAGLLLVILSVPAVTAQKTEAFANDPLIADQARSVPLGGQLELSGLDFIDPGQPLQLRRFDVWTPGAQVVIHNEDGIVRMDPPRNAYFSGELEGAKGSRAFLTILESGEIHGLASYQGRYWIIGNGGNTLVSNEMDERLSSEQAKFQCDSENLRVPESAQAPTPQPGQRLEPSHAPSLGGAGTYTVTVAAETDFEFYNLFGNSTDATNYIADLIAYNSGIYADETDANLALGDVTLWTTASDPWTTSNSLCALLQFGKYWNTNNSGITRTIAHFFSGKNTGGGIAWVGVLCNPGFSYDSGSCGFSPQTSNYGGGYGFTGSLTGGFDINNPQAVWDIVATGHEIGHNFNSPHTHCYGGIGGSASPVDQCYGSEGGCYSGATSLPCGTAGAGCGTMMSYCHLLSGGLNNISLTFGENHAFGVLPSRVPTRMGDHVVSVAGSSPSCITTSCTPPNITANPSSATKCPTQSVTFTVTATGATSYQWKKGNATIGGATSSSYTINSVSSGDAGSYTCDVTNACDTSTSTAATLTVTTATAVSSTSSNLTRCIGTSATFTVTATGVSLTYQWRLAGTPIDGATSASYTINAVDPSHAGAYTCVVTGTCGSDTSSAISLTVSPAISVDSEPSNQTGCVGDNLSLSVTASGGASSLTYQWYQNNALLNGATSSTLSLVGVTTNNAGDYFCRITDTCGTKDSATRSVTVNEPASLTSSPSSATRCEGDSVTFSVGATGTSLSYQWKKNSSNIDGATSSSYSIPSVAVGDAGAYTCLVSNSCTSVLSGGATLTVNSGSFSLVGSASHEVQGLELITLTADVSCNNSGDVEWFNLNTGDSLGLNLNPVTLNNFLSETTTFQVTADNGSSTLDDTVVVIAAESNSFLDLNGDGCNTIEDIWFLADEWGGNSILDANGDEFLNTLDFLYIDLTGACP